MANHFKRAYGFFKCQVCLSRWTSSLAWAKKTDSGRIGYRYGQICKSVGCEGSGHRIYVKPYELVSSRCKLWMFFIQIIHINRCVIYNDNVFFRYFSLIQILNPKLRTGNQREITSQKIVKCATCLAAVKIASNWTAAQNGGRQTKHPRLTKINPTSSRWIQ